jgi:hypothetical protein
MELHVQVRPDVAQALSEGQQTPEIQELEEVAAAFGVRLERVHPGTDDEALATYLAARVHDDATGEEAAAALRRVDAVVAANVEPTPDLA